MSTAGLTDKQRQALEHVERAHSQGMKLSDFARAHGVSARAIYDGLAALDAREYCREAGRVRSRRLWQCASHTVRSRQRRWCTRGRAAR